MDELDGGVIVEILNRVELTPKQLMRAMLTCQRFKEACERGPLDLRKITISSCEKADSFRDFLKRVQAVVSLEVSWALDDADHERLLSMVRTPSVQRHITKLSLSFQHGQYNVWCLETLSRALSGVNSLRSLTLSCRDFMGLETELDVHHLPEQAVGPFASLSSLTVCLGANRGLIDVLQYFPAVTKLDLDAGVEDHIWCHFDILVRSDVLQYVRLRSLRVALMARNLHSMDFHGGALAIGGFHCDIDVLNVIHDGRPESELSIEAFGGSRVAVDQLLIGKEQGRIRQLVLKGDIRARCLELRAPLSSRKPFPASLKALVGCGKTIRFGTEAFASVGVIPALRENLSSFARPPFVEKMEVHVGPHVARLWTVYEELAKLAEGKSWSLIFVEHRSQDQLGGLSEAQSSLLSPLLVCSECQSRCGMKSGGSPGTKLCPCSPSSDP